MAIGYALTCHSATGNVFLILLLFIPQHYQQPNNHHFPINQFSPPDPYRFFVIDNQTSEPVPMTNHFLLPPRKHHDLVTQHVLQTIQSNYRKHERPNENLNQEPTIVYVFIRILDVSSIDVVRMQYTVNFYLRQQWTDTRLAWAHLDQLSQYNESILLTKQKSNLWIPDLFFRNSKDGFNHDMLVPNYLIRLKPNGDILYSQKITMILSCSMYLKKFPMDRQNCRMDIGSYGYTLDELKFVWIEQNPVTVDENIHLLEFAKPTDALTTDCTKNGTTDTGTYSCLLVVIQLQRQVGSYFASIYIPEMLIVTVSWLGFWIDVKAVPARLSLGLLTLLGLLTEGSSVSSKLPRVTYVKAIDVWIIACLLFVIGVLAEFAVAYWLAPRSSEPEWEQEALKQIDQLLRQNIGQIRCCCCYTHNTTHKPLASTVRSKTRKFKTDESIQLHRSQCQIDRIGSLACCNCSKCIHLQCARAPKRKTNVTDVQMDLLTSRSNHPRSDGDSKHICIVEPSTFLETTCNTSRRSKNSDITRQKKRPIKPAIKSTSREPDRIMFHNHTETQKCIKHSSKIKFHLCTLLHYFKRGNSTVDRSSLRSPARPYLPTSNQLVEYESQVDAYSRFLFPAGFLLFNCFYWIFYLYISKDSDYKPDE